MSRIAHISGANPTSVVIVGGNNTPTDNYPNPSNAVNAVGLTMVWDGATWDRWTGAITATGAYTPSDAQANPTNLIGTEDFNMFWDGFNAVWRRWGTIIGHGGFGLNPSPTVNLAALNDSGFSSGWININGSQVVDDAVVGSGLNGLLTVSPGYVFDASTGSHAKARAAYADALSIGVPASGNYVFNGTNWDRMREGTTPGSILVNNPTAANLLVTATLDAATLAALESITVQNGAGAAAVNIQDGGNSITVDAVDLDIRNLVFATDKVDVSGSAVTADTELPAASALADTDPNPTTPRIGSNLLLFNGATWDRARSAGSIGALQVGGVAAHDTASAGNPVLIGGHAVAESTTVVDVTAADVVRRLSDLKGRTYVVAKRPSLLGIHHVSTPQSTITAAADGALVGRHWLINPVGSGVLVSVRRIDMVSASGSALVTLTAPIMQYQRVTFTGTASGATVAAALRDSTDAAAVATLRTASTGLTLTAGAAICNLNVHTVMTAVGESRPVPHVWEWDEEVRIVLRAGQGIVLRQTTAGTAADTRFVQSEIIWEEYTA